MDPVPEKVVINVYFGGECEVYADTECRSVESKDEVLEKESEIEVEEGKDVELLQNAQESGIHKDVKVAGGASKVHQKIKPFLCKLCGKGFTLKGNLKVHMRSHTNERPFTCLECGQSFRQKITLQIHRRSHTGEKPYSCDICGERFGKKEHFVSHARIHSGEKPFSCLECGKSYRIKESLTSHVRNYGGTEHYGCGSCRRIFTNKWYFDNHLRLHAVDRPFICDDCGKRFSVRVNLALHLKMHKKVRPFTCRECGSKFSEKKYLKRHAKIHAAGKPFFCHLCGKRYTLRAQMKLHMGIHSKVKCFRCSDCDKWFSSKPLLGRHMIHHRRKREKRLTSFLVCPRSEPKNYSLKNRDSLVASIDSNEESKYIKVSHFRQNSFECVSQDSSVKEVEESRSNVHESYECTPHCSGLTALVTQGHFPSEIQDDCNKEESKQANIRPFTVMRHGKFGSQKTPVGLHVKANFGDTPFTCKDCGKELLSRGQLDLLMEDPTRDKSLSCNECGKRYQIKRSLVYYTVMHKGKQSPSISLSAEKNSLVKLEERSSSEPHIIGHFSLGAPRMDTDSSCDVQDGARQPFVCNQCGKSFKMKSLLNLHYSSHLREKPFTCRECGRGFSSKPFLGRHMHRHKRNRLSPVNDTVTPSKCSLKDPKSKCDPGNSSKAENNRSLFPTECHEIRSCGEISQDHVPGTPSKCTPKDPKSKCDTETFNIAENNRSLFQSERHEIHSCEEISQDHVNGQHQLAVSTVEMESNSVDLDCRNGPTVILEVNGKICNSTLLPGTRYTHNKENSASTNTAKAAEEKHGWKKTGKSILKIENKPFSCQECGKGFMLEENLEVHFQTHSGIRPFPCTKCKKGFNLKRNLELHMEIHTHGKPYIWWGYGRGFIKKEPTEIPAAVHTNDLPLTCSQCGKSCSSKGDLDAHQRIHTRRKPFECGECGKVHHSKKSLNTHLKSHKTGHFCTCNACGRQFFKKALNSQKVANKMSSSLCKKCEKHFKEVEKLSPHSKVRGFDKSLMCGRCGEGFNSHHLLNMHRCSHNSGILPSRVVCKRDFVGENSLDLTIENNENEGLIEGTVDPVVKKEVDAEQKCEEQVLLTTSALGVSVTNNCRVRPDDHGYFGQSLVKPEKEVSKPLNKDTKDSPDVAKSEEGTSFECEKCGERFSKKRTLDFHVKMHSIKKHLSVRNSQRNSS